MWISLAIGCAISTGASVVLTIFVRSWLPKFGLTDKPDGERKTHTHSTPVGGGVAIFAATTIAVAVVLTVNAGWRQSVLAHWTTYFGLWLACLVVTVLGLIDDAIQLRGRQKLLGQLLVALVIVATGMRIQQIEVFGMSLDFGIFAVPMTVFWLLATINAVNLLDGIDGLATSTGIIISVAIAIMALIAGHLPVAMICLLFAAGLAGFLIFNFPPATIFLGDTGSMLIGTVIGALAVQGSFKVPGTVLLAAPWRYLLFRFWIVLRPCFDARSLAVVCTLLTAGTFITA